MATIVVARWEGAVDLARLRRVLASGAGEPTDAESDRIQLQPLGDQLSRVHDAERVERLLDRAQGMDARRAAQARELGALQLADAVLGGDRAAGGGDQIVDQARDRGAFGFVPVGRGVAAGADVEMDVAVAEMAEAAGDRRPGMRARPPPTPRR